MSLELAELLFEGESSEVLDNVSGLYLGGEDEQAGILARMSGLKFVGAGISKAVYSYGRGRVVKFALNEFVRKELLDEAENFSCSPGWFPQVFDVHPTGNWAVVERIPVTNKTVGRLKLSNQVFEFLGLAELESYERFLSKEGILQLHFLLMVANEKRLGSFPTRNQKLKELISVLKKCSVGFLDLHLGNVGFRRNGQMVIFDSMQDDLDGDFEEFR